MSDARDGDEAGVDRQEADCRKLADRLGWTVADVFVENNTSAYKRRVVRLPDGSRAPRVVRPEFRRMLDALASGALDALVAYDLDRVARDPRDLEDLIDVVESNKIPTHAVTGSLDLSTDSGVLAARVNVAVANKSSRDTSRRVKRKHEELAEQGKWKGGGLRRYGYAADRLTIVPAEAEIVREMITRIINNGDSLNAIAADLTARGVPTALGSRNSHGELVGWHGRSVHSILTGGHIAGLRVFRGEIVGDGDWPAIISRAEWEDVRAILHKRRGTSGNALKHWLVGVVVCGHCDHRMVSRAGRHGPRYTCLSMAPYHGCGRTVIKAAHAEETVEKLLLAYLSRPDVLADLSRATDARAATQARTEAADAQGQLDELARTYGERKISMSEYLAARGPIAERLARWQNIVAASVPGAVRRLANADDVAGAWAALDARARQEVAQVVFPEGVRIVPPRWAGVRGFDPHRVRPPGWELPDDV